ncbi:hypothetical protein CLOM_g15926 [Closterium sp. NIES-68]|nr:hypothetical protein CLOM_g15765 [Closterium sp. NIES-68]GJP56879.1 hypothetical protein CLOM_g15926 [Closterium sp. NIES-68]
MFSSARALRKKQKELQSWEAALRQKEEELAKREDSLGIMTKNFPPFFPLIRNNIREDVPEYLQGLMFLGFWVWMGTMAALLYNLVPITATWVAGAYKGSAGFVNFFMALLYFIIGVPGPTSYGTLACTMECARTVALAWPSSSVASRPICSSSFLPPYRI